MKDFKFSVAISVYKNDNSEHFYRSLESITKYQTLKPDEVVLVVDGPVGEDIKKVIKEFEIKYNFFNVIKLEKNEGLGNALRVAVNAATYDLIARMDSDDISLPTRFEQQINMFKHNHSIDIVGGDISEFINKEDNIVAKRIVPKDDIDIKKYMQTRCAFNHVTVMYKKQVVLNVGNYKDLFWNEDYYLWIRMMEHNKNMCNIGTVLVNVRVGENMYKRRGGIKYFKSEMYLQNYMLDRNMISYTTYLLNISKRVIIQLLIPNNIRGWIFKKFARR